VGSTLQLKLAASLTKSNYLYLCFDNDSAGRNAILRLEKTNYFDEIKKEFDVEIKIVKLPFDCKDPGDYIENNGGGTAAGKKFEINCIGNSISVSDFVLTDLVERFNSTPTKQNPNPFDEVFDKATDMISTIESEQVSESKL